MRTPKTNKQLSLFIKSKMCLMGISSAEMAVYLRISSSTFSRRMNNPEDFTVANLKVFCDKLKIQPQELNNNIFK